MYVFLCNLESYDLSSAASLAFLLIEGRMHDARILGESGLMQQLSQYAFAPNGTPLCLYGDPAYPLRVHLQQPFRNNDALTDDMRQYNKAMRGVRVSVEWFIWRNNKIFQVCRSEAAT